MQDTWEIINIMDKDDVMIAVNIDGEVLIHIRNIGPTDHVTLCGVDGTDETIGQRPATLPKDAKIDCNMCRIYWDGFMETKIRKSWFK